MQIEDLQKRIDETLEELKDIHVDLDPDPLEYGPDRISLKFALLDKFSQRLTQMELQLVQDIHQYKRFCDGENLIYETEKYKLMATNPRVKAEKTKAEREAAADRSLSSLKSKIRQLNNNIADLDNLLHCVRLKRKELSGTESRLRNQMKMVQEMLTRLGGAWKRKSPPKDKDEELSKEKISFETSTLSEEDPEFDEEQLEIEKFLTS
jgi:chromosome segregation ATPase